MRMLRWKNIDGDVDFLGQLAFHELILIDIGRLRIKLSNWGLVLYVGTTKNHR